MKTLRILSYNIHKGFTAGRRKFVLERIREAIRLVQADIVFLQEVQGEHRKHSSKVSGWPDVSQFEFLADEVWSHTAYAKNAVYEAGHHGNAILSKYPVLSTETIIVSAHRFEQRGLLHAVIDAPGCRRHLHALCVHFGLTEPGRQYQLGKLLSRVDESVPHSHPLIIAGDFNDWTQRATKKLSRITGVREVFYALHGSHARTYPSVMPFFRLDRIYCRGFNVKSAEVLTGKPWNTLSDHAAVFSEISLETHTNG